MAASRGKKTGASATKKRREKALRSGASPTGGARKRGSPTRQKASAPTFRELSRDESEMLLRRNHVGRIAFAFHERVDVEPVHYVFAHDWLHGRTTRGTKIATLLHRPWVAFEVDEIDGLFDWKSVVVHGSVHIPDENGSASDQEAYADTLQHVRELVPNALHEDDPAPGRTVLFRVHADAITGRAASTRPVR